MPKSKAKNGLVVSKTSKIKYATFYFTLALQSNIDAAGILKETTGYQRNRVFSFENCLQLFR